MIFTSPMKQLVAVVLKQDEDEVTKELLSQGVLDFMEVKEVTENISASLKRKDPDSVSSGISELRRRIESFLNIAGINIKESGDLDILKLEAVDLKSTEEILDKIAVKIQSLRDRQKNLQQEILKYEDIKRQLDLYDSFKGPAAIKSDSLLRVQTGVIGKSRLEGLKRELSILPTVQMEFESDLESSVNVVLINMKRDDSRVNSILAKFGWVDYEMPEASGAEDIKEKAALDVSTRIYNLKKEQDKTAVKVKEYILEKELTLTELWSNLRMNELYLNIQAYYSNTSRTVIFTGWVPSSKYKVLEKGIKKAAENRCYMEWNNAEKLDKKIKAKIPVKLESPGFLSPFQMLVKNYATPEYGTIDPTAFVAVSYLIMFGLMFGDAGHGLVLVLAGVLGLVLSSPKKTTAREILQLIIWCGCSSIVMGILFGSYFGMPWFKPLWFDYHGAVLGHTAPGSLISDVYGILGITIYFGITVISIGLILNWINLISQKNVFKLIFDKAGFLGSWIYGGGIYTAFYFVSTEYKVLPDSNLLFWIIGLPALLFTFKAPIEFLIHKKHGSKEKFSIIKIADFSMEWIVEMLEIFSGYLANTLSFMRVAGLGIAHVSLMVAFFQISAMIGTSGSGISFGQILVLVLGNTLVIALEGLSAGIQSLRLNYYEFFTKYFNGTGKAYSPISLKAGE